MASRRKSGRLNVFLNSRLVGQLNREASGAVDFRYDAAWLHWTSALAVSLSLPLREDRYIGAPVTNVFDNLLPDNLDIRKKIAGRVGADGVDAFNLLAALGRDCVGALQFLPDGREPGPAGQIEGHTISDRDIAVMIGNLARHPLGLDAVDDFRISLAGAQEKTALLRHRGRWKKPIGTTATTHILKPQIGELPNGIDLSNSVENEYFCLNFTKALGLPSAEVGITDFGKGRVLIVERFDRIFTRDGRLLRIPQEDCCQALSIPWTRKYESDGGPGLQEILKLLEGSDGAAQDRQTMLKTMIAFWLLAATDGHAKNFSIFLAPGGGYQLTPIYDVLSAQPSLDAKQIRRNKMKLAMAVGDTRHYMVESITGRHFLQSAAKAGINKEAANGIIDEVLAQAPKALDKVMEKLPRRFPRAVAEPISRGIYRRLDLLRKSRD